MKEKEIPGRESRPPALPAELSAKSKLVYFYLHTVDGCHVDELQDGLGLKQISLYPVLESLTERELVRRDGMVYLPQSA